MLFLERRLYWVTFFWQWNQDYVPLAEAVRVLKFQDRVESGRVKAKNTDYRVEFAYFFEKKYIYVFFKTLLKNKSSRKVSGCIDSLRLVIVFLTNGVHWVLKEPKWQVTSALLVQDWGIIWYSLPIKIEAISVDQLEDPVNINPIHHHNFHLVVWAQDEIVSLAQRKTRHPMMLSQPLLLNLSLHLACHSITITQSLSLAAAQRSIWKNFCNVDQVPLRTHANWCS